MKKSYVPLITILVTACGNNFSSDKDLLENNVLCDPYETNWDMKPEGEERADCFGIKSHKLKLKRDIANEDVMCTEIYYGNCEVAEPFSNTWVLGKEEPSIFKTFNYNLIECSQQGMFAELCFSLDYSKNIDIILGGSQNLEAKVVMYGPEERVSPFNIEDSDYEIEPIVFTADCPTDDIRTCDVYATK